jgi:Uma2 family endonuclease
MVAARSTPPAVSAPSRGAGEQRFVLNGVSWRDYLVLRDLLDSPGLRMAYSKGALELMSPSEDHEHKKKLIARLFEVFALERDVPLDGKGSTTYRREAKERGLEPDECYFVGPRTREFPDIAIEVVVTSGGIDKLDIYQALGVREVWFWENDAFHLHALTGDGYVPITRSALVPGLDFELLATFVRQDDQHRAVRAFRDLLRA